MLEGRLPFRAQDWPELLRELKKGRFHRLPKRHPKPLRTLIRDCLRVKVSRRCSSAAHARERLEAYLRRSQAATPREEVAQYLLLNKFVDPPSSLFPKDIEESTRSGPLARAFSLLAEPREVSPSKRYRWALYMIMILALLWVVIAILAEFGHSLW